MKKNILAIICCVISCYSIAQPSIFSPDKKIEVKIIAAKPLQYAVYLQGKALVNTVTADLYFNTVSVLPSTKPLFKTMAVSQTVAIQPSFKHALAKDEYNLLTIRYNNSTSAEIRLYNEGATHRFITNRKDPVEVTEQYDIGFGGNYTMYASIQKEMEGSYEVPYTKLSLDSFPTDQLTYLPLLMDAGEGRKIFICDADVVDYPHLFLKKGTGNQLKGQFPMYPTQTTMKGDRASSITQRADFIAKTTGKRTFPWRVILCTDDDRMLLETDIMYLLATAGNRTAGWVKPGRVAWDWWNASNLYGVNFKAGLNTETWKYYMDFAARNGIEYLILDEGWSISTTDISQPNKDLDLPALIAHGNKVGVKLILWSTWRALMKDWTVLDQYKQWGIAGVKVDFMDRADQWMVNFYEKAADETYRRKLMIDFHGAYKPEGLRRRYPNVIAYEGVCGLEQNKWSKRSNPRNNTLIPFIRMVPGPMDYTPGAMRNYHEKEYAPNWNRPGSMGTRCQQVGIFIIYETGLQMLADSPSNYDKEKETFDFLQQIPVVWDDTRALEAKAGEYIVMARKKGNDWFVGGMTSDASHKAHIEFNFLGDGDYEATIMQDGVNVAMFAEDYSISKQTVNKNTVLDIDMYKGGGLGIIVRKK